MSKSTLSIAVPTPAYPSSSHMASRTVEVPCRLPEAFDFAFSAFGGTIKAVAYLSNWDSPAKAVVGDWEMTSGPDVECADLMTKHSEAILTTVKSVLGLSPQTHSVAAAAILAPIALAYEAEVAAYDAAVKAHAALPRVLHSLALLPTNPAENDYSPAVLMFRKYVEHVVEQACKAQTERAEAQAKVTP